MDKWWWLSEAGREEKQRELNEKLSKEIDSSLLEFYFKVVRNGKVFVKRAWFQDELGEWYPFSREGTGDR